jgi:hypothetical protein
MSLGAVVERLIVMDQRPSDMGCSAIAMISRLPRFSPSRTCRRVVSLLDGASPTGLATAVGICVHASGHLIRSSERSMMPCPCTCIYGQCSRAVRQFGNISRSQVSFLVVGIIFPKAFHGSKMLPQCRRGLSASGQNLRRSLGVGPCALVP